MNSRRIAEMQARIENCTNQELNAVIGMIKNQRQRLSANARSSFTVGQKVTFSGMTGHIEKLARTRAIVQVINGPRYRVVMSTLEAA